MQQSDKKIYYCCNCQKDMGSAKKDYCAYCNTPEKRKEILEENNKIREAANLSPLAPKA